METELESSFASAVQYAKACVCLDDDIVLKNKQVEVLKSRGAVSRQRLFCVVLWQKPLLPASTVFVDHKRCRIGAELSVVIVVSPLVSLMVDQVSTLGVSAAILSGNSGVDKKYLANEGDIKTGQYRFLYRGHSC